MESEMKFEYIKPVEFKELEEIFDDNGKLTEIVPRKMVSRKEAEEMYPSSPLKE